MSKTAKFIKDLPWSGDARLYKLSHAIGFDYDFVAEKNLSSTKYVVVSGVDSCYATETYIFPADKDGETLDMGELDGSFQGEVDHDLALSNAGYEII